MSRLEEITEQAGYALYAGSPAEFITSRMTDLARIREFLISIREEGVQRRLRRVFAKNAGFIAIRIIDVADQAEALEWLGVAYRAAHRADDSTVKSWVAGYVGTVCACYSRSFKTGLEAARMAQSAGTRHPSAAAVLGHLAEAGVQARMGQNRAAMEAIHNADQMFSSLPEAETAADGYHVTEYFLRWHQSNALTALGRHAEADVLRTRALELPFSRQDRVGQELLHLDAAASKIEEGEVDLGRELAAAVWDRLPSEYRIGWLPRRVSQILGSIKPVESLSVGCVRLP
ncbi:hypothetical protein [Nocardia sp. NPDC051570]|uniref:hypothetical protein n=1 Tax=Nocardia sp. NPDC051570 TaxID=3364324 RepID=UPI00378B0AC8